jgi:hypothetical protein
MAGSNVRAMNINPPVDYWRSQDGRPQPRRRARLDFSKEFADVDDALMEFVSAFTAKGDADRRLRSGARMTATGIGMMSGSTRTSISAVLPIMIGLRSMQPGSERTAPSNRYQIEKTLRNDVSIKSAHPYLAAAAWCTIVPPRFNPSTIQREGWGKNPPACLMTSACSPAAN